MCGDPASRHRAVERTAALRYDDPPEQVCALENTERNNGPFMPDPEVDRLADPVRNLNVNLPFRKTTRKKQAGFGGHTGARCMTPLFLKGIHR